MSEIHFLSHQYNIAKKILIFNKDPQPEKFKKFGFLSSDSNEHSYFHKRELKSNTPVLIIFLLELNLIFLYHINIHDIYNKVGHMSISILGEIQNINNMNDKNTNIENLDKLEDEMM